MHLLKNITKSGFSKSEKIIPSLKGKQEICFLSFVQDMRISETKPLFSQAFEHKVRFFPH
jgi:hypothetical protein